MNPVTVRAGDSPVILGFPHGGTFVPDAIRARLNDNGLILADTDWHIARLYDGLLPGATCVEATFHRYVIDANRDPSGHSLYPGQNTTTLCPLTDFDGVPIWKSGQEPAADDIEARRKQFHAPYHAALAAEVERVKSRHGVAIVHDCHSIRSRIPYLFDGVLPDFNIGTDNGKTCDAGIERLAAGIAAASSRTSVLNGRFRGGWTTRHYGQPGSGVHAIQMEIAQSAYLAEEAPPFAFDPAKADVTRSVLRDILAAIASCAQRMPRHG
ncbi:MAG: N-formylglutamate deformylase [Rhizobiales bacterium]|nr:N-formylglutamate deformylase [Hyphomicrobiales bacterium]